MGFGQYEVHFAPLQGYTDATFRNAFNRFFGAVDLYYTPFIRMENGGCRKRDIREIDLDANAVCRLVPQIMAGSRDEFCFLVDLLQSKGYRDIDLNLGCPFPPVASKRKGAGILPYPELIAEMLTAIRTYPDLSFSVKMRLGWENSQECLAVGTILNELPLKHVTMHARIGKQQYKGETLPDAFSAFYECCKHPLFYNGDLVTAEQIHKITQRFPALKGVALGRGLLANPFLAKEYKEGVIEDAHQKMSVYQQFHEYLMEHYASSLQGDAHLLMKMKTFWEYFFPEADRKCLKSIKKANKLQQYTEAVKKIWMI